MQGNGLPEDQSVETADAAVSTKTDYQGPAVTAASRASRTLAAFSAASQPAQGSDASDDWGMWDAERLDADEYGSGMSHLERTRLAPPVPPPPASVVRADGSASGRSSASAQSDDIATFGSRMRAQQDVDEDLHPRWRSGLRRVVGWIGIGMVWAVLAALVALTWGTHMFDYRTHVIVGKSMEPTIPLYSVIVGEQLPAESVRVGDVITFTPPTGDSRVTHRVIEVDFDDQGDVFFRTQGDNNETADPWKISYVGDRAWLVTGHIPYIGQPLMWMQSPLGRILFVVVPTLLLLGAFLRWVWLPRRRTPDEHSLAPDRAASSGAIANEADAA